MKLSLRAASLLVLCVAISLLCFAGTPDARSESRSTAVRSLGNLPLSFEPAAEPGHFLARSGGYSVSIGAKESIVALPDRLSKSAAVLRFGFDRANGNAQLEPFDALPGVTNYYLGNDASQWRLGVKNFARLRARGIYPGVDVVYYGDQRRLEFDFLVAPGADPRLIGLNVAGMDKLYRDKQGNLVAELNGNPVIFKKPYAYQRVGGADKPVDVEYVLAASGKARLRIGNYDKNLELVIDPVVSYATYLGGTQSDSGNGIAVDATGAAYVTGMTCSNNFPQTSPASPNPSGRVFTPSCNAFVTKINPAGTAAIYTTLLGGTTPNTATASGNAIALDASNQAYVVGTTNYTNLPAPVQGWNGGDSDAFILILSNTGTLVRLTYLGGSDADLGFGVAVDSSTNVIAVGQTCSGDFPHYNGFQPKIERCVAFVTKLNNGLQIPAPLAPNASYLTPPPAGPYFFSSFYGGQPYPPTPTEFGYDNLTTHTYVKGVIIEDANLNIEIALNAGTTGGGGVPVAWPTTKYGTVLDGTILWEMLGPYPALPLFATTEAYGVALDPLDDIFVAGATTTSFLAPYSYFAGSGAWVLKVGKNGAWAYSTALGSNAADNTGTVNAARAIAVDTQGRAYVVGTAKGGIYTTSTSAQPSVAGGTDAFAIRINNSGSLIEYGTYIGGTGNDQGLGVAADANGGAYITGSTASTDLPLINPLVNPNSGNAAITALGGTQDAFVTKLTADGSSTILQTYLGGSGLDQGNAIAIDKGLQGDMYIAGTTSSLDLTTLQSGTALQAANAGLNDAFAAKIPGASIPAVTVVPGVLNFGTQDLNIASAPLAITYTNGNATSTVHITSIVITGDFAQAYQGGDCSPGPIAPNAACKIFVVFTPTAQGLRSGTVTIVDDAGGSPRVVNLTGTGAVPFSVVTPASLTFGNQELYVTSATQPVKITNTGTGSLNIASIVASGDFAVDPSSNCGSQVAAGANCTINVSFTPTVVGSRTGSLTITDNAPASPHVVGLSGTGILVTDTVSTNLLAFGSQQLNVASAGKPVTLTNTSGTRQLVVKNLATTGDYSIAGNTCTTPVAAGGTCTFNVVFTPSAIGSRPGTLTITGNGTTFPSVINLTGAGGGATSLAPNPVTFSATNVNSNSSAIAVTFTNVTNAFPININSITITGAAAADYSQTNNCGTSVSNGVSPANTCTINVVFRPTATGNRNATLTVVSDSSNSPDSVSLIGTGTAPAVAITPASLSVSFGNQPLSVASAPSTVNVSNTGSGPLNIASIAVTGDFQISSNTCGAQVLAGANCNIGVTFTPTAVNGRAGTLTITDNAPGSPHIVNLSGTGVTVPNTVAPLVLHFLNNQVGVASAVKQVTVSNTDPAFTLNLTSVVASAGFSVAPTTTCGLTLAHSTSCTIDVKFTASAVGLQTGTLTISGSGTGFPVTVSLDGFGGAQASTSANLVTFPNTNVGATSAGQTVTLTNSSSFPLNILAGITTSGDYAQTNNCGTSVAANSFCTISVVFKPTATGVRTGVMTITSDASAGPLTVNLTGFATAPIVSLSPNLINFGNQSLGVASAAQAATLKNIGDGILNILGVSASGDFQISNNACGSTLAAGATCTINVTFTPSVLGSRSGSLTISDDATGSPQSIQLAGTAVLVKNTVAPSTLSFGNQLTGVASAAKTVTVTNTDATQTLTVTSAAATGDYTVSSNTCASVAPGANCTIGVVFTPTSSGHRTGTLVINGNGANFPYSAILDGFGGAQLTVDQLSLAFPSTNKGTTSPTTKSVILTNASAFAANLSGISTTADYQENNNCPPSLAAGANCTITVAFSPTAVGPRSGSLTITSDAANSPLNVSLTGTGTQSAVSLSAASLIFAATPVGLSAATQTINLVNSGNGPLAIASITATGDFSQTNTCGTGVPAPQIPPTGTNQCTITVTFSPTAVGVRTGTLTIVDDAPTSPQTINLTGTGAAVSATVSPVLLSFGSQTLGVASAPLNVNVTNTSASFVLNVTSIQVTGDFQATNACASVAASSSCAIPVTFSPTVSGHRTGTLVIAGNGTNFPITVQLDGFGGASASVNPTSVALPSTKKGTTSPAAGQPPVTVTLTNNSAGVPLNISSIATTGDFQQTNTCGSVLAGGATCTLTLSFTPTATGIRAGVLTIYSDGTNSPQTVNLSGVGTAPNVTLSTPLVNFGAVGLQTTASTLPGGAPAQVVIQNSGDAALTILGVAVSGDFAAVNGCPASLGVGATCTVSLSATPTQYGTESGTLTITDDATGSPQTVQLSVTGSGGIISISPNGLIFPDTQVAVASAPQTVTLTNTGAFSMSIAGISVAGDFAQTNTCPAALAAGANCVITVTFTPLAPGPRTTTLTITGQAQNSPVSASISGKGVPGPAGTTDFVLTADKTTVTGAGAQTVNFNVAAKPIGGFNVPVTITCVATGGLLCTPTPSSIPMDGSATGTASIAVFIPGPTYTRGAIRRSESFLYAVLPFSLFGGLIMAVGKRRRRMLFFLCLIGLIAMVLMLNACGSGGGSPWGGGTPPGNYTCTVSGSGTINGTAVTHTVSVTIVVQ